LARTGQDGWVRFSVWLRAFDPWDTLVEEVAHIDSGAWCGVWVADHFMPQDGVRGDNPPETWAILAGIAAVTDRVRLGPLVCGNTYRHPAVLAAQAATVDTMSGGRVTLGLGAGWQQNEHDAYGIVLPGVKERLDRLEEACQVVRAITTDVPGSFSGEYYQVADAFTGSRSVQKPMPLLIGGSGERRSLKIAARYAQMWNCWGDPATLAHKCQVLDRHCEDVGRDPSEIDRSAQLLFEFDDLPESGQRMPSLRASAAELQDTMAAYSEAGVDEVIVPDWSWGTGAQRIETLDRFLAEVAAPFLTD
jgi:F420-dependent oxidoreductase-like protein